MTCCVMGPSRDLAGLQAYIIGFIGSDQEWIKARQSSAIDQVDFRAGD